MKPNIDKQIDYLIKLTDKIGIIEHSSLDEPNLAEGYCVDDNARALQACLRLKNRFPLLKNYLPLYFHFLNSAFKNGHFYNDLNADLSWQSNFEVNGEHYGRTLAALGETTKFEPNFSSAAKKLFDKLYSSFVNKTSSFPRVSSQIILGLKYYRSEDIKTWADTLVAQYLREKTNTWDWYEPLFSYDNSRMPLALLVAYQVTSNPQYLKIALKTLDFLTKSTFDKKLGYFIFPGTKGIFGQQPIEAGSAAETYSLAYQITQKPKYKKLAQSAFNWYRGQNILNASLINPKSGGVYDGLEENGVNLNQGAESVLSYLLAYNALENLW